MIFFNKINIFGNCKQKSHFKKVPLLIFQFPSPPTLNNWLFHLLYLYSFVTYLYSSAILFFFFWCLLVFFFLLFFLPHPPLTRPHEAKEWQPLPILACFSSCFGRNRPYQPVSVAVSARIGCIGMFRWPFRPYRFPFLLESARIWPSRRE